MTTPVYKLKELTQLTPDQLWEIPKAKIIVQCDDGDYVTTTSRMRYAALLLTDFYRLYPDVPAKITHLLPNGVYVGKMTHADLINRVLWDVYDTYLAKGMEVDTGDLAKLAYEATNRLYNEMSYRSAEYVQSIDILDYMDVIYHPAIKTAQDAVVETESSIQRVYDAITTTLRDRKELKGNRLANVVKTGGYSDSQVVQTLGPVGYRTDIDSYIFPVPILVGFTHGFHNFYDSLTDSRLASKSSSFTGPPLQATEYFNRQLQLLAHTFMGVVPGDCGSTETIAHRMRRKDLAFFDGKYHVVDGKLFRISKSDTSLIDKMVYIRSPTMCHHPNTQYCCTACYGELALSFPRSTNVGHVAATNLGEKISQQVLSIKHVESSSSVSALVLSDFARKYIQIPMKEKDFVYLADRLSHAEKVEMVIYTAEAPHIADIQEYTDLKKLKLSYISELSEVQFRVTHTGGTEEISDVSVYMDNRPSSLTHAVLAHMKEAGLNPTPDGRSYIVDLTTFDATEALFELPRRHVNMLDYAESIKSFLCAASRKETGKTLRDYNSVEPALKELYEMVSSRMSVNIVHLETLIRSTMVRSRADRDYRLPRAGNQVEFGEFTNTVFMRSMSAAMAYQGQRQALERPSLYLNRRRPMHTLDYLFVPNLRKVRDRK